MIVTARLVMFEPRLLAESFLLTRRSWLTPKTSYDAVDYLHLGQQCYANLIHETEDCSVLTNSF